MGPPGGIWGGLRGYLGLGGCLVGYFGGSFGPSRTDLGVLEALQGVEVPLGALGIWGGVSSMGAGGAGGCSEYPTPVWVPTALCQAADAGLERALGTGHRPCRHRHPGETRVPNSLPLPRPVSPASPPTCPQCPPLRVSPGRGGALAVAAAGFTPSGFDPLRVPGGGLGLETTVRATVGTRGGVRVG